MKRSSLQKLRYFSKGLITFGKFIAKKRPNDFCSNNFDSRGFLFKF